MISDKEASLREKVRMLETIEKQIDSETEAFFRGWKLKLHDYESVGQVWEGVKRVEEGSVRKRWKGPLSKVLRMIK